MRWFGQSGAGAVGLGGGHPRGAPPRILQAFKGVKGLYCDICDVPLGISRGNVWYADGTISGKYPPYIKGTFFDVDELGYLFRSLSEYMDYDIGDIIAGGKYHDTKEYMTAMVEKMKETSGGKLPPDEDLYRTMLYPICIWGIADVEFLSIEPDKMVIAVKRPYSIPLLRGDVAGVADVVTGREHTAVWEGDEYEGVMTVAPAQGGSALGKRIDEGSHYDVKPEAEELACVRCEACDAPTMVSELFEWERDRCRIEERSSGRRYCFNNTQGINAVLKMLVGELGEDTERKIEDIAREYSRTLYEGRASGLDIRKGPGADPPEMNGREGFDLETELDSFPYRGWGKVSEVSTAEDAWLVTVENPYSDILVAGRIWGMEEAFAGGSLHVAGRVVEGKTLRLTFEP